MSESSCIFIDKGNKDLGKAIYNALSENSILLVNICDFDDVEYQLQIDKETINILTVRVRFPLYPDLIPFGIENILKDHLKGIFFLKATEEWNIVFQLDKTKLPATKEVLSQSISEIRSVAYSVPLSKYFNAIHSHTLNQLKPVQLHYRLGESIYIVPYTDSVSVIFGITAADPNDMPLFRVTLQEYVDAQRRVPSAPSISFSAKCPADIQSLPTSEDTTHLAGYLNFTFGSAHVPKDRIPKVCTNLMNLRSYLGYHMSALKTELHYRLRGKTNKMLHTLSDARIATEAN